MSVQLPPETYAATRTRLEVRARAFPSDGETPWDQRRCDAFVELIRSPGGRPAAPAPTSSSPTSPSRPWSTRANERPGRRARAGRVHKRRDSARDRVRRHRRHRGRRRRRPHDVRGQGPPIADRRPTPRGNAAGSTLPVPGLHQRDLHQCSPCGALETGRADRSPNLALMCRHHHRLVHSKGWHMSGNANEELTFVGPSGRVMTTRPSPRWTAVRRLSVWADGS